MRRCPRRASSSSTTTRPTGPGELADAAAPTTSCTARARRGSARAYTAGFAHALASGADYVVEMDADLSHDPADLPRLIAPALDGADLVLGSRYVHGGGIENWGLQRRVHLARAAASTPGACSASACAT